MAQKKTKTAPAAKTKTAKRGAASKKSGAAARGGAAKPASRAKKSAAKKPTAAKPSVKKAAKAAPAKKKAAKPAAPKRAPKSSKSAKAAPAAKRATKPKPKPADEKLAKRTPRAAEKKAPKIEKKAPKAAKPAAPKSAPAAAPAPVKVATRGSKPKGARSRRVEAATESFKPVFTAKQLQPIRERLLARKEEIVRMYRADLRSGQESNDSPTEDLVDRANNAYSRELSYSISDAERALVLQIDEALARVEDGSYGRCAHCGRPIAQPRLEALPWARLCIDCAELLEKGLLTEP